MAKKAEKIESFEEKLTRLQAVVARLEQPELPLEESLALYKEGLALSRACRDNLDKARNEVRVLTAEGEWAAFTDESNEGA